MNDNLVHSDITGIDYSPKDVVRLLNLKQICTYLQLNKKPVDIYPSKDYKTGDPVLVVLFNRQDTKDVYERWCNSENLWEELQHENKH